MEQEANTKCSFSYAANCDSFARPHGNDKIARTLHRSNLQSAAICRLWYSKVEDAIAYAEHRSAHIMQ